MRFKEKDWDNFMIKLTKFNGMRYHLNAEIVKSIEGTPDTVITLLSGEKVLVRENPDEVVRKIIEYKRLIHNPDIEINGDN
jgi:flagellar protein FlbD